MDIKKFIEKKKEKKLRNEKVCVFIKLIIERKFWFLDVVIVVLISKI
jgi:hypothetical protein